ncbi:MAG: DNA polymerase I [Alphaproteobacteria bacterium]|jgi:DNA polymerase-1|nr:DNA polymerase I [Alphaproteobacteria bacterium]
MTEKKKLYLVDGSGFIFRAFHATPVSLTRSDGTPINAVMGFCNMLFKLVQENNDSKIVVVFDAARKNFRNDIYADYKANRGATPEELIPQFPIIREAVDAFNIPHVEMEGYEADDLIATYSKEASKQGIETVIVSSDKDLMQLVGDGVYMFDSMKSKTIKEEQVFEKFGVTPDKVIDVQALAGDSSDNVPGVEGIGVKTGAQLINEYGSLENLLDRASEIKQNKRREKLIRDSELAKISKQLVTLKLDVPVEKSLDDLKQEKIDLEKLVSFMEAQSLRNLITRVKNYYSASIDDSVGESFTKKEIKKDYKLIQDKKDFSVLVKEIKDNGLVAVDTETDSLVSSTCKLIGISFATEEGKGYYLPLGHKGKEEVVDLFGGAGASEVKQLSINDIEPELKAILEDESILKVGHNLKYDYQVLKQYNIALYPVDDTMLMSYLLDGSKHGHSLDELSELYLNHENVKYSDVVAKGEDFSSVDLEKACEYASEDADMCLRIYNILKPRMIKEKVNSIYQKVERPLIPVIADMEYQGVSVDTKALNNLSVLFEKELDKLTKEIYSLAGEEFNIASPAQLSGILFEKMGIVGGKKTKTGKYSTNSSILEPLSSENPIVEKVLKYRKYAKLDSTYAKALPKQIQAKTGKIHTSYAMTGTNTGRLSSSNPNLQNIPAKDELGREIRRSFIASKGNILVSADYSQIELRLVAEMSNCKAMKDAFNKGEDIHKKTASLVFGVPEDDVTSDLRYKAKAINFGIIYGISAHGLSVNLGCSRSDAKKYIDSYLEKYKEIKDYMDSQIEFAKANGFVKTMFGRKIYTPTINDSNKMSQNFAIRQAMNAPIQGTGADIIKLAMIKVKDKLDELGLQSKMILQVHDELIVDALMSEKDQVKELLKSIMESAVDLSVEMVADPTESITWEK